MTSGWIRAQDRKRNLLAALSTVCLYAIAILGAWLLGSLVPASMASVPGIVVVDLLGGDGPQGVMPQGLEGAPERPAEAPPGAAPLPAVASFPAGAAPQASAQAAAPAGSTVAPIPEAPTVAAPKPPPKVAAVVPAPKPAPAKAAAKVAPKALPAAKPAPAANSASAQDTATARAEADRASAEQAAAERAAADQARAAADQARAAADQARAAADQASAEQAAAASLAAAQQAAAERIAAAKAAADKAVADEIAARQAAREKADADALAAERNAPAKKRTFGSSSSSAPASTAPASTAPASPGGGTGTVPGVPGGTASVTFRGSEMGNALATTFGASSGQVGRNIYVPIYLYMPLPSKIDGSIYRNILAKETFRSYYQQSGPEWRLRAQVPLPQRGDFWTMLEAAGYDASLADFKTDRKLSPVVVEFAVGPLSRNKVDLIDLRLSSSSGSKEVDEAVIYGFRQATFFNKTGNAIAGKFVYGF